LNPLFRTAARHSLFCAWLILLPISFLVACGAGRGAEHASFDARCAQLPPPKFEVVKVPVTFSEDYTQSIDQLTVKSGDNPETRLTFGLTTGNFSHDTEFELRSVDDPAGGRTCGSPSVHVIISMQPVVVYVASEVTSAACPRGATFKHELKHVAVFRQTLDDAVRELTADIARSIGTGLQRASSQPELERQFKATVTGYLSGFIKRWHTTLTARHEAVDSTTEYGSVREACP
jgi:hypothetical protein